MPNSTSFSGDEEMSHRRRRRRREVSAGEQCDNGGEEEEKAAAAAAFFNSPRSTTWRRNCLIISLMIQADVSFGVGQFPIGIRHVPYIRTRVRVSHLDPFSKLCRVYNPRDVGSIGLQQLCHLSITPVRFHRFRQLLRTRFLRRKRGCFCPGRVELLPE